MLANMARQLHETSHPFGVHSGPLELQTLQLLNALRSQVAGFTSRIELILSALMVNPNAESRIQRILLQKKEARNSTHFPVRAHH